MDGHGRTTLQHIVTAGGAHGGSGESFQRRAKPQAIQYRLTEAVLCCKASPGRYPRSERGASHSAEAFPYIGMRALLREYSRDTIQRVLAANVGAVSCLLCPGCDSENCVKDGRVKGRHCHLRKECGDRHTVQHLGKGLTSDDKPCSCTWRDWAFARSPVSCTVVMLRCITGFKRSAKRRRRCVPSNPWTWWKSMSCMPMSGLKKNAG